ncbi:unnamed protein product [Paramecium octaurelia]|uniref:Uncharacterized protein n=1 Tax=Paramecium octaurelia TaxID=43137 RepID=A0A8S1XT53_PAROT|nr:unnamed protein product [Paramecium octaurelia]
MLDGSDEGEVNALAITKEREHFVSGGEDKEVKLWGYDEGICYTKGQGHSGQQQEYYFFILRLLQALTKNQSSLLELEEPYYLENAKAQLELPNMQNIKKQNLTNYDGFSVVEIKSCCQIFQVWNEIIQK